jgi:hypothetical protein
MARVSTQLEAADFEPEVERFVEIGCHLERSGVPCLRRSEIRGSR